MTISTCWAYSLLTGYLAWQEGEMQTELYGHLQVTSLSKSVLLHFFSL